MNKVHIYAIGLIQIFLFSACSGDYFYPDYAFDPNEKKEITDFSVLDSWAAHPEKEDTADRVPKQETLSDQSNLKTDVFFIHPTTLTGYEGEVYWNGNINDSILNKRTDETTILFQASIFNASGKVYAPRYQQAHVAAYYSQDKDSGEKALAYAYKDVAASFEYYMEHFNKGRPFILASHSQGTTHAKRLIHEYIDGKEPQKQLIAAYLVGVVVKKDEFISIHPCENPEDTGCTISWRTFRKDIEPENVYQDSNILATNPLSWKTNDIYVPKTENKGSILRDIDKIYDELVDAQVDNGIVKVSKPSFFGSVFYTTKNYHIPDLNFFYFNTRENAVLRAKTYLSKTN